MDEPFADEEGEVEVEVGRRLKEIESQSEQKNRGASGYPEEEEEDDDDEQMPISIDQLDDLDEDKKREILAMLQEEYEKNPDQFGIEKHVLEEFFNKHQMAQDSNKFIKLQKLQIVMHGWMKELST